LIPATIVNPDEELPPREIADPLNVEDRPNDEPELLTMKYVVLVVIPVTEPMLENVTGVPFTGAVAGLVAV
jgi:hypothetical protein